eukprot:scaffold2167_cov51-Attheya_sp.AAC.5
MPEPLPGSRWSGSSMSPRQRPLLMDSTSRTAKKRSWYSFWVAVPLMSRFDKLTMESLRFELHREILTREEKILISVSWTTLFLNSSGKVVQLY